MIFLKSSIDTNKPAKNLLPLILFLGVILLPISVLAGSNNKVIDVNLKQQTASTSLIALAKQANVEIVMPQGVDSFQTSALKGQYTFDEALKKLLVGSDWTYEFTADDSVVIKDSKSALLVDFSELEEEEPNTVEDENVIKVTGQRRVLTRNRVDSIAPILSYDVEYFQRFEPNTLRDMLKRVPGIISDSLFSSDGGDLEADSVKFRGLKGAAGQILINGRRVPGVTDDNALSLSSLPAGIIQEVQIIRGATAKYANEGTGLTINIILKDGESLESDKSSNYRAGLRHSDNQSGFNLEFSNAGRVGEFDYFVNLSYSNAKTINDSVDLNVGLDEGDLNAVNPRVINTFSQNLSNDQLEQLALNGSFNYLFNDGGELKTEFFLSSSDRADDGTEIRTDRSDFSLDEISQSTSTGDSDSYNIAFVYDRELEHGRWQSQLSYSRSKSADMIQGREALRGGVSFRPPENPPLSQEDLIGMSFIPLNNSFSERTEIILGSNFDWSFNEQHKISTGLQLDYADNNDSFDRIVSETLTLREITNNIRLGDTERLNSQEVEKELALFVEYEVQLLDNLAMNIGTRYERTESDPNSSNEAFGIRNNRLEEFEVPQEDGNDGFDGGASYSIQPSVLLQWRFNEDQALRLSWTTSVDAPDISERSGFELTTTDFTIGNPELEDSELTTTELGFDWRLGEDGVFGITAYRKKALDSIEPVQSEQISQFITRFPQLRDDVLRLGDRVRNVNALNTFENNAAEQRITGVELDFSLPLTVIGLPDLSLQSNVTYIEDESTFGIEEVTAYQASYNITLDYQYESWGFGVSYNDIGDDDEFFFLDDGYFQIVELSTDNREAALDLFVKKDFENFSVNLAIENAFDAKESRISNNSMSLNDPLDRASFSKQEIGPQYILSFRGSF